MEPLFQQHKHSYTLKCPICKQQFSCSEYLKTALTDPLVLWFANMVTHYRHDHISSWNKCWGYGGSSYRRGWFGNYEEEKQKVNERAKRQIIRKCKDYLNEIGMTVEHIKQLQNTSEETIKLATKYLKEK